MSVKLVAKSLAIAAAAILALGGAAEAKEAVTTQTASPAASSCTITAHGTQTLVGFPARPRWTVVFRHNCAGARVRAVAECENTFGGARSIHYGAVENGNATSYYTCNTLQVLVGGGAQWYNGVKWINI